MPVSIAAFASGGIIFFGQGFLDPVFFKILLTSLVFISFFLFRKCPSISIVKQSSLFWFVILLQFLAIFMPPIMSDDVLRHIHDGYYLLQGVDVYSTAPELLPQIASLMPNHSHLGSIYFPFTQTLAMLGSWVHIEFGYLIVFHIFCTAIIVFIYRNVNTGSSQWMLIFFTPFMLFVVSGHHADYLGMLIVIAGLVIIKKKFISKHLELFYSVFFGIIIVILPATKPEGFIWSLYLGFIFIQKKNIRHVIYTMIGLIPALLTLVYVSINFLWTNMNSLESFLSTARFFSEQFVAYNPIPDLLGYFFNLDHEQGILYSKFIMVTLITIPMGIFYIRAIKVKRFKTATLSRVWHGRFLYYTGKMILTWGLLISILHKGVWHPWYFLWLVPLMIERKRFQNMLWFGVIGLALFYLPVIDYRNSGQWNMNEFYLTIIIYLFVVFLFKNIWKQSYE